MSFVLLILAIALAEGSSTIKVNVCHLRKASGPCFASMPRYYFNRISGKCEHFIYGGCKGNGNNFKTLDECEKRCSPVKDICKLPKVAGPCEAAIPRYYFSQLSGKCERFLYGGCKGNSNNFETLSECETACPRAHDICKLPKVVGPCEAAMQRYYFNQISGTCERFVYGGCKGNKNNFQTLPECKTACPRADVCLQPMYPGPCRGSIPRYYFNREKGKCEEFTYGGCSGNDNNFKTLRACNKKCPKVDVCRLPKVVGPCFAAMPRYYFNQKTKKCEYFIYGGCKGNGNNFDTIDECKARCRPKTDVCKLPKVIGPCDADMRRYYFSQVSGKCERFSYGGCQGNSNNFKTMSACESRCPRADACLQPMYVGQCKAAIPRYYFNHMKGKCEMFTYGGCNGNDNNFETLLDCINRCPGGSICPLLKPGGICVELCASDDSCKGGQKCCSNGCGRVCTEPFYPDCPGGKPVLCFSPACDTARCPRQTGAKCIGFCNECISRFFDRFGNEVTDKCQCNKNEPEVKCKVDPCSTATCPGYKSKDIECRSNHCGGCKAVFYDKKGSQIKCKDPRCPATKPYSPLRCHDECSRGSCKYGMVCCSYGCSRMCVYPKQPDRRCPPPDPRIIEKLPVILCPSGGCKSSIECTKKGEICCFNGCSKQCRKIPRYDAQCSPLYYIYQKPCPHYCTSSNECRSDYMCCRTNCGAECMPKPVACPPGTPIAHCVPGGPCKYASCANYPKAKCRANICGTCVAEFYDEHNRIIRDCISGPSPFPLR